MYHVLTRYSATIRIFLQITGIIFEMVATGILAHNASDKRHENAGFETVGDDV